MHYIPPTPAPFAFPDALRAALALLRPYRTSTCGKVRIGARHDGGYVMLDAIAANLRALSLGVGHDDRWEMELAERGLHVEQYDDHLTQPPSSHTRLRFHRLRVTPFPADGCVTLAELIAQDTRDALLKIDIEGAEWDVLDVTPPQVLARCPQICVEFHGLLHLRERRSVRQATRIWRKLHGTHAVVHVHGNNYAPVAQLDGANVPDVLEVTFASRLAFAFETTSETFPGALDAPNDPTRLDIPLGTFCF